MTFFTISVPCLGYELSASTTITDEGVNVLLTGGCKPHVGAVSLVDAAGNTQTIELPGHRDGMVSEKWGKALASHFHMPAAVTCGIHYDGATRDQISEVLANCDVLLARCMEKEPCSNL